MIGDVLSDALADIEGYETDPATSHCYKGNAKLAAVSLVAFRDTAWKGLAFKPCHEGGKHTRQ